MAREMRPRSEDQDEQDEGSASKRARYEYEEGAYTQRTKKLAKMEAAYDPDDEGSDDDDEDDVVDNWGGEHGYNDGAVDDERIQELLAREEARRLNDRAAMSSKYEENAGWIKEIHLVDFMCHRNLSVSFGKNLNFLVGHNGSGKSAVLTALSIGLGGSAALTKRAMGLKELIRGSESRAIITVVLHNRGYNEYRHDTYGDNIYIERTITRSGSNTWKFRSSREGKIHESKKAELDRIRAMFLLDCDQPLTVLTQDAARSFLQQSDAKALYKFFLRGTNLDAIRELYYKAADSLELARVNANHQKQLLVRLEAEAKECSEVVKKLQNMQDQKVRLADWKKQRLWEQARLKEEERDRAADDVTAWKEKLAAQELANQEKEAKLAQYKADIEQIEEEIKSDSAARKELERKLQRTRKNHGDAKDALDSHQNNMEENRASMEECERDIAVLQGKLREKRETLAQGRDPALDALRVKLDNYRLRRTQILEAQRKTNQERIQAEKARDTQNANRDAALNHKLQANREVQNAEEEVDRARRVAQDSMSRFGQRVDLVLADIDRERWNGVKPIGPIGRHISLRTNDEGTKQLFTHVLSQTMCGFIVTDSRDRTRLQGIIQRNMQKGYSAAVGIPSAGGRNAPKQPIIINNSGDMFDYSQGDRTAHGSNKTQTLMSAMDIDDELVRRVLINSHRIEKEFFTKDREDANNEIKNRLVPTFGQATVHCSDGMTLRGDKSSTSASPWRPPPSLFVNDAAAHIRGAERRLQDVVAQRDEVVTAHDNAIAQARKAEEELATSRKLYEHYSKGIRDFDNQIARMENELPPEENIDIDGLEGNLQRRKMELEECRIALEQAQAAETSFMQQVGETKTKMQQAQADVDDAAPAQAQRSVVLEKQITMYTKMKKEIDTARNIMSNHAQKKLDDVTADKSRLDNELEAMQLEAEASGERVRITASLAAIEAHIKKIERDLQRNHAHREGEFEEAQDRLNTVEAKIHKINKELHQFNSGAARIDRSIEDRLKFWQQMLGEASIRTRGVFSSCMFKRKFIAKINMNHASEELIMGIVATVAPAETGVEDAAAARAIKHTQYKSALVLSGGERSFSTVSLLLALWESTGGPLRCMDEWDVFLDGVNRDLAAGMLIDGAKATFGKQYILITPQNMGKVNIEDGDNKIIRMADPDRNQGTLGNGRT